MIADSTDIERRVRGIIAALMGLNDADVLPKLRLVEDIGCDDLAVIEIVLDLEEAFEIDVPEEDLPRLHTVADACAYVADKLRAKEPS